MSSDQTGSPVDGDSAEAMDEVLADDVDGIPGGDVVPQAGVTDEVAALERPVGRREQLLTWCRQRWGAVLLAGLLLVSAGAAAGVYWGLYRPDQLTDAAARTEVADAARDGTVAVLSYTAENVDKDIEKAKDYLTGPFLTYYSEFTTKMAVPAAKQKGIKTEATVVRAAVSEMHPDKAVVLVFVNQVSTSRERPEPTMANSSVMVTMVKSGGRWLISEFNPV